MTGVTLLDAVSSQEWGVIKFITHPAPTHPPPLPLAHTAQWFHLISKYFSCLESSLASMKIHYHSGKIHLFHILTPLCRCVSHMNFLQKSSQNDPYSQSRFRVQYSNSNNSVSCTLGTLHLWILPEKNVNLLSCVSTFRSNMVGGPSITKIFDLHFRYIPLKTCLHHIRLPFTQKVDW